MKKIQLLFTFLLIQSVFAQDIVLTFEGIDQESGLNTTLDKVTIENLTNGKTVELTSNFIFNLSGTLGLPTVETENTKRGIQKVYPNPFNNETNIQFYSEGFNNSKISIFNLLGQEIAEFSNNLPQGVHKVIFTPNSAGIYFVVLRDNGNTYYSKIKAKEPQNKASTLTLIDALGVETAARDSSKKNGDTFFTPGDALRLTGYSNNLINSVDISPTQSETITFRFEPVEPNLNGGDTLEQISKTSSEAISKLNELLVENDLINSLEALKVWLESSPNISEADISDGNVEIKYSSGTSSFVIISLVDEDGNRTKGGGINTSKKNNKNSVIKLEDESANYMSSTNNLEIMGGDNIITDRDVFIFDPFESNFQKGEGDAIKALFDNANLDFNVKSLKNEQCTISSLSNLTEYGFIYFSTHGVNGNVLWTRERVVLDNEGYEELLFSQILSYGTQVEYKIVSTDKPALEVKGDFWGVTAKYISALNGEFTNSVIFNSSCQSSKTDKLYLAFKSNKAKTYLGFDVNVLEDFSKDVGVEFVSNLLQHNFTTGKALNAIAQKKDERPKSEEFKDSDATIKLLGDENMTFFDYIYPETGAYGVNILNKENDFTPPGNFSMHAIIPEGKALRVKITGSFAYVGNNANIGDWTWTQSGGGADLTMEFTSTHSGSVDFWLLINPEGVSIEVYENGDTTPTWTR